MYESKWIQAFIYKVTQTDLCLHCTSLNTEWITKKNYKLYIQFKQRKIEPFQIIISIQNNLDGVFVSVFRMSLVLSCLTLLQFVKIFIYLIFYIYLVPYEGLNSS